MPKNNIPKKEECRRCPALCCKNLAMIIGRPHTRSEIEDLKWQIRFDTVKVFITNHRWHLWVKGKCMYLTKDNRCKIYDRRPERCRRYNPPNCEARHEFYDVMLSTPDELEEYLTHRKEKERERRALKIKKSQ